MRAFRLSNPQHQALDELARRFGLQFIRMHGSMVERPETARDADIVIDRSLDLDERGSFDSELSKILGKTVDLVELDRRLSPLLAREIGQRSIALWERDGTGRIRYAELIDPLLAVAEDERLSLPPELRLESIRSAGKGPHVP